MSPVERVPLRGSRWGPTAAPPRDEWPHGSESSRGATTTAGAVASVDVGGMRSIAGRKHVRRLSRRRIPSFCLCDGTSKILLPIPFLSADENSRNDKIYYQIDLISFVLKTRYMYLKKKQHSDDRNRNQRKRSRAVLMERMRSVKK